MSHPSDPIDVRALIDSRPLSRYQFRVVALCFLTVVADGFDVVIMGIVAPALKDTLGWTNDQLAPAMSAALVGLLIGALVGGPMGDRVGRHKLLYGSLLVFGLFTLLAPTAGSIGVFMLYRFVAGLAMGSVMPITVTLATEYAPAPRRGLIVSLVFGGFTVGSAFGSFLAARMLHTLGWESVFIVGGIVPIVLGVLAFFGVPESLTYLVHKGSDQHRIRRIVERCAPGSTKDNSTFVVPLPPQAQSGKPLHIVFNHHYRTGTLLTWATYFLHLFLAFLLASWMPTMIREAGMRIEQAAIISGFFYLGGPVGAVCLGWLMDRRAPDLMVAAAYVLTAVALALFSAVAGSYPGMIAVGFLLGIGINGGGGLNALASSFFPLPARATGNSWMHGIGRLGAIASSFAGAWMLNAHWPFSTVALAVAIPALLISTLLVVKYWHYGHHVDDVAGMLKPERTGASLDNMESAIDQ